MHFHRKSIFVKLFVLGKIIKIRWKVKNHGLGQTPIPTWTDYIYWTRNFTTDLRPHLLDRFQHYGKLPALGIYEVSYDVTVPKYIFGRYFIAVHTDGGNAVFEHLKNDNNVRVSVS